MLNIHIKRTPKLCNVAIGDIVRLPELQRIDSDSGEREFDVAIMGDDTRALYMVCADASDATRPAARRGAAHGLYDDKRPLFLLNLRTGCAVKMPHLSSRVEVMRNATLTVETEEFGMDCTTETAVGNG